MRPSLWCGVRCRYGCTRRRRFRSRSLFAGTTHGGELFGQGAASRGACLLWRRARGRLRNAPIELVFEPTQRCGLVVLRRRTLGGWRRLDPL